MIKSETIVGVSIVNVSKAIRNGVAGALIAAMPVSSTIAAVRPGAAVPAASSASVSAQGAERGAANIAWLPVCIIIATVVLALVIASKNGGHGSGNLSRG